MDNNKLRSEIAYNKLKQNFSGSWLFKGSLKEFKLLINDLVLDEKMSKKFLKLKSTVMILDSCHFEYLLDKLNQEEILILFNTMKKTTHTLTNDNCYNNFIKKHLNKISLNEDTTKIIDSYLLIEQLE